MKDETNEWEFDTNYPKISKPIENHFIVFKEGEFFIAPYAGNYREEIEQLDKILGPINSENKDVDKTD